MKRLFLTLLCLFTVCSSFAQTNEIIPESHLKFKGIPIDGTPSEFRSKLQDAGFSYDYKDTANNYWYKGSFAGYNNCEVIVKSANNLVYEVVAIFPKDYTWNQLYGTYSSLKQMLTTKYGEPRVEETFKDTPIYIDINKDEDKYREVGYNRCCYFSLFTSLSDGLGTISLEIKSSHCVGVHYIDFYNERKKNSSAINDL